MAKRGISATRIDSVFNIPRGAEDEFEHTETPLETEDFDTTIYIQEPVDDGLATPDTFTIVNQTLQRGNGNQQRVDVTFETDIIEGATHYEYRVVKGAAT